MPAAVGHSDFLQILFIYLLLSKFKKKRLFRIASYKIKARCVGFFIYFFAVIITFLKNRAWTLKIEPKLNQVA